MSSLSAIFRSPPEQPVDNEKLLQLYWNRNELKKEFARLQKEQLRLKDKIKGQQGSVARLQQKLDYLEELLLDPVAARNVLIHYQLRGISLRCRKKLEKFAEQLKQQREQKLQSKAMAEWSNRQSEDAAVVEQRLYESRQKRAELVGQFNSLQQLLGKTRGLLRFFKRRQIRSKIEVIAGEIDSEESAGQALQAELEAVNSRTPPEAIGLDIAAKRSINFMILSFVQQLFVQFGDEQLVGLVKDADDRSVGAINYGSENDCEQLMRRIRTSSSALDKTTDFTDALQKRARLIGEHAMFNDNDSAVPVAASVSTLFRFSVDGSVKTGDANLLGANYWGVADVLSR